MLRFTFIRRVGIESKRVEGIDIKLGRGCVGRTNEQDSETNYHNHMQRRRKSSFRSTVFKLDCESRRPKILECFIVTVKAIKQSPIKKANCPSLLYEIFCQSSLTFDQVLLFM